MPAAKRVSRLRHVPVKLRVTVDPKVWDQIYGTEVDLAEDVRRYVTHAIAESAAAREDAIVSVRRDGT